MASRVMGKAFINRILYEGIRGVGQSWFGPLAVRVGISIATTQVRSAGENPGTVFEEENSLALEAT